MNSRVSLAVASATFLTTCCPTLWLTVTKSDPVPRFASSTPEISASPIVPPPVLTNRCDVLAHGKLCAFAPDYTDQLDDAKSAATRALAAFSHELERFANEDPGEPILPQFELSECIVGTVTCLEKDQACNAITTKAVLKPGLVAHVITPRRVLDRIVENVKDLQKGDHHFLKITAAIDGEDVRDGSEVRVCILPKVDLSRPLLSFIHMSDIQLRDGSIKLEDPDLSKRLDWLIQSFEYDPDLQTYNPYVVEALFATINAEVASYGEVVLDHRNPLRPGFIMHTGDSIDAGMMSELRMFHHLVHTLKIPLFEVIGNHDALVFGNLVPTTMDSDNACASVRSVAPPSFLTHLVPEKICVQQEVTCPSNRCIPGEAELVAQPTHVATLARFIGELTDKAYDPVRAVPGFTSTAHGFDPSGKLGYYYFFQALPFLDGRDAKAIFVALDSEELGEATGGTDGRIGPIQAAWLHEVIDCEKAHPDDMMFVFAHQPISGIKFDAEIRPGDVARTLEDELNDSPNMVAYLYGHYHEHRICDADSRRRPGSVCSKFWEIETGSIIEFPQEARMVRVKQARSNLGFLELFTFTEHLDARDIEYSKLVNLGRRGAERDHCRTHSDVQCSDDLRPYRTDGRDANARLFFKLPHGPAGRPATACTKLNDLRDAAKVAADLAAPEK